MAAGRDRRGNSGHDRAACLRGARELAVGGHPGWCQYRVRGRLPALAEADLARLRPVRAALPDARPLAVTGRDPCRRDRRPDPVRARCVAAPAMAARADQARARRCPTGALRVRRCGQHRQRRAALHLGARALPAGQSFRLPVCRAVARLQCARPAPARADSARPGPGRARRRSDRGAQPDGRARGAQPWLGRRRARGSAKHQVAPVAPGRVLLVQRLCRAIPARRLCRPAPLVAAHRQPGLRRGDHSWSPPASDRRAGRGPGRRLRAAPGPLARAAADDCANGCRSASAARLWRVASCPRSWA